MSYDKRPSVKFDSGEKPVVRGWPSIMDEILSATSDVAICLETYPGVDLAEIEEQFVTAMDNVLVIRAAELMLPETKLSTMLDRFLTDDRVFGYMAPFQMSEFFDPEKILKAKAKAVEAQGSGRRVLIIGCGAGLVLESALLVYADMPRWEIQRRMRAGQRNLTIDNPREDILVKYKRGYFIEWRAADRWKMSLFDRVHTFLDTTIPDDPRSIDGETMRAALQHTVTRPFRVVPYFDPGVWGGNWMKDKFELPDGPANYAWGFDCVPEENSLVLDFDGMEFEIPSINLVLRQPEQLLGARVYSRFGPEFPIRFDFLDTIGGGNLSLQVHPLAGYARDQFGISYTQDESYYILEARPDACVYLGMKDGVRADDFFSELTAAQSGGLPLDVEKFVNKWPAAKHDHFSIPAGTIHCSGSGSVVLEISATPYIFTFKLWDWGRLGLDGLPRPVHIDHGKAVLREDRDTTWAEREVIDHIEVLSDKDGVREERTGLHPLEFIETRRHWFTERVEHFTEGSVHVLNLVEGDGIIVESPAGTFKPFRAGYAETFIVPAGVEAYTIRPVDPTRPHATIRASVRS